MSQHVGIYNLYSSERGGGEKRALAMADSLSRDYDVTLISGEECDRGAMESYFGVDLSRVRILPLHLPVQNRLRRLIASGHVPLTDPARARLLLRDLRRLLEPTYAAQIRRLHLDLFINNCGWSFLPCQAPRGIYMCMFPHEMRGAVRLDRTRGALYRTYAWAGNRVVGMTPEVLASYDIITANSQFTAGWIRRLWNAEARVVYSACEPMGPPGPKEKLILNVGRFVAAGRNDDKHQHTMLEAFERSRLLLESGWRLHFAGSMAKDAGAQRTIHEMRESASGLPVEFSFDAPFDTLRSLYRRASIYWHATGYGFREEEHPGKQEHFGITTVEAMSAGAVPVVIHSGGQRESVTHGSTGFLWNSLDEMLAYTERLAANDYLRATLSRNAVAASAHFSRAAFTGRVREIAAGLLAASPANALQKALP